MHMHFEELLSGARSKPGDAKWNPNADLDGNGVVALIDLLIWPSTTDNTFHDSTFLLPPQFPPSLDISD